MLEQTLKSSGLLDKTQKLRMDFKVDPSIGSNMINEDEIDPIRLRTALFALMTTKLEDAHETAVKGQSTELNNRHAQQHISDLDCSLDEIQILLNASALIISFGTVES